MIRCAWFLTDLRGGGAERVPLLLGRTFGETHLEVVLLKNVVEHMVPSDGPRIVALSDGRASLYRSAVPIFRRAVRVASKADILVAGLEWAPTYFATACGLASRTPFVAVVQTDLGRFYAERRAEHPPWALRWCLNRASAVVAVSEDARTSLVNLGVHERRLTVIRNPAPAWGMSRAADRGLRRILTVGSLKPIKGIDVAVSASAQLRDRAIEWEFVGDGPERPRLIALAHALGVAEMVRFTGFAPDVRPHYTAADIFVLPSRTEGSPLVLAEAMAAGLPIVATRCGTGVEALLGDGRAGILVPADEPQALADAVRALLDDPAQARRLGAGAAERAKEFSAEAIAGHYESLFREVLGRG